MYCIRLSFVMVRTSPSHPKNIGVHGVGACVRSHPITGPWLPGNCTQYKYSCGSQPGILESGAAAAVIGAVAVVAGRGGVASGRIGVDLSPEAEETEGTWWGAIGMCERLGVRGGVEVALSSDFALLLRTPSRAPSMSSLLSSIVTFCAGQEQSPFGARRP